MELKTLNKKEIIQIQERLNALSNEFDILIKDGIIDSIRGERLKYDFKSYCDAYEKLIEEVYKSGELSENAIEYILKIGNKFEKMKYEMDSIKLNIDMQPYEIASSRFKDVLSKIKW